MISSKTTINTPSPKNLQFASTNKSQQKTILKQSINSEEKKNHHIQKDILRHQIQNNFNLQQKKIKST